MEITNNDRKFGALRVNISFIVIGIIAVISFSIVLLVYSSLISDDILMIPAILLNIISLVMFLFRPRKLVAFWIGFILILLAFNGVMYIATGGRFYSDLLFSSSLASILLLLPLLPSIISTSSPPSAIDQINVEWLGRLYSWIFFVQVMFLILLTYRSNADISVKGPSLLIDVISCLIIIYEFDQRARFKVSPFDIVLKALANVFKTISFNSISNIPWQKLKNYFTELIEKFLHKLHKIKCLAKPIIEELEDDIIWGILITLILMIIFPASLKPEHLTFMMTTALPVITTIIFLSSIGINLYRKCKINLMFSSILLSHVLLIPFQLIRWSRRSIINTLLTLVFFGLIVYIAWIMYVILAPLNRPILIMLIVFLFFVVFILAIQLMLALAIMHIVSIIENKVLQIPTILTMTNNEAALFLSFSIAIFVMFIFFSLITCLRHDTRCEG